MLFNGITFADMTHGKRVLETSHPPVYYSNSIRPLRLTSYLAVIAAASAIMLLLYSLSGLIVDAARGWVSLMSVLLLIGAAQLLVLGVIGEYFGRL